MERLDDEKALSRCPPSRGAYRLYRGDTVIFIGVALELRPALEAHRRGAEGECTKAATGFDCQPHEDPVGLQRQWLAQYARDNGGALPECNDRRRNGNGGGVGP